MGDKEVDVHAEFRMYMSTKMANPAYTPEVSARTSIIDFTVTVRGLEDQLLARVIVTEKQVSDGTGRIHNMQRIYFFTNGLDSRHM